MEHTNYDYLYWNNTFTATWYAIPRDKYLEFFSGKNPKVEKIEGVKFDKDINALIAKVTKTKPNDK